MYGIMTAKISSKSAVTVSLKFMKIALKFKTVIESFATLALGQA